MTKAVGREGRRNVGGQGGGQHARPWQCMSFKSKKAKNPFNQAALDRLNSLSIEPRYANAAHYPRLFRKGMSALAAAPFEIRTVEEAMALKGVGRFLAGFIAGTANKAAAGEEENFESDASGARRQRRRSDDRGEIGEEGGAAQLAAAAAAAPPLLGSALFSDAAAAALHRSASLPARTSSSSLATTASSAPAPVQRRARNPPSSSADKRFPLPPPPSTVSSSAKSRAYAKAVLQAEGVCANLSLYEDWAVVLLLDKRERKAEQVCSKLRLSGLNCETRNLPIGDMLWIARGRRRRRMRNGSGSGNGNGHGHGHGGASTSAATLAADSGGIGAVDDVAEVVLGTVVERKTLHDLASSLFGTRFEEQRLRLKRSAAGASQVIYLVECDKVTDLPNCPVGTLRYAMMQTCVNMGFAVVRTRGLDDTVRFLRAVHRRLLRRAFPSEFAPSEKWGENEVARLDGAPFATSDTLKMKSLPSFASPRRPAGRKRGRATATAAASASDANRLLNLTFSVPPVPYDSVRLRLYDEFRCKIELDRESGTRSVGAIFRAMLKQVEGFSGAKVHAVADLYETPSNLWRAYVEALTRREEGDGGSGGNGGGSFGNGGAAEALVKDVVTGNRLRVNKIGPKSSVELCRVFTAGMARATVDTAATEMAMAMVTTMEEEEEEEVERTATAFSATLEATTNAAAATSSSFSSSRPLPPSTAETSSQRRGGSDRARGNDPSRSRDEKRPCLSSSVQYVSRSLRAGLLTTGEEMPLRHMNPNSMGACAATGLDDDDDDDDDDSLGYGGLKLREAGGSGGKGTKGMRKNPPTNARGGMSDRRAACNGARGHVGARLETSLAGGDDGGSVSSGVGRDLVAGTAKTTKTKTTVAKMACLDLTLDDTALDDKVRRDTAMIGAMAIRAGDATKKPAAAVAVAVASAYGASTASIFGFGSDDAASSSSSSSSSSPSPSLRGDNDVVHDESDIDDSDWDLDLATRLGTKGGRGAESNDDCLGGTLQSSTRASKLSGGTGAKDGDDDNDSQSRCLPVVRGGAAEKEKKNEEDGGGRGRDVLRKGMACTDEADASKLAAGGAPTEVIEID